MIVATMVVTLSLIVWLMLMLFSGIEADIDSDANDKDDMRKFYRNLIIFILIKKIFVIIPVKNSSLYPGPLIKLKSGIFSKIVSPWPGSS